MGTGAVNEAAAGSGAGVGVEAVAAGMIAARGRGRATNAATVMTAELPPTVEEVTFEEAGRPRHRRDRAGSVDVAAIHLPHAIVATETGEAKKKKKQTEGTVAETADPHPARSDRPRQTGKPNTRARRVVGAELETKRGLEPLPPLEKGASAAGSTKAGRLGRS